MLTTQQPRNKIKLKQNQKNNKKIKTITRMKNNSNNNNKKEKPPVYSSNKLFQSESELRCGKHKEQITFLSSLVFGMVRFIRSPVIALYIVSS